MRSMPMSESIKRTRAPRNRTLTCDETELAAYASSLLKLATAVPTEAITDTLIHQDIESALPHLPDRFVDLLVLDPPYNLTKNFNGHVFRAQDASEYQSWFERIVRALMRLLK